MFRSSLCVTLIVGLAAVCYTPRADAFIFGELKELGRAVVGTVKGVGQDVRSGGHAVKNAFTPDRSPSEKYRREYDKRMSKAVREQRREVRRAERSSRFSSGDSEAEKTFQKQVKKAEKRMRQAQRRSEELSRRDSRRSSQRFGASGQERSKRMREELRWFQEKREARRDDRQAKVGDFRKRYLDRR